MSGVFGCWHLHGRTVGIAALRTHLDHLSPGSHDDTSAAKDEPIGRVFESAGGSADQQDPSGQESTHTTCVFDGRIDNRDELLAALRDHPGVRADCCDRDLVRVAYERFGDAFIDRIRGDFALGLFDRQANRLLLARDRVGVRPLCYTHANGTFLFASDAKTLLRYPGIQAVPDDVMLADFVLRFLSSDGQRRTFFRGIHSLPPAHLLIVTPAGSTLHRYFEFDTGLRIRFPTFRAYADAFHERFVASVRNRLRSEHPVAVSVSGGLDSAYIFCVAHHLVRQGMASCPGVLGFNYAGVPGTPSDERDFVTAIERSCGTTIDRIAQRPGFMQCAGDEVWHSESPLTEGLALQRQAMLRRVRESGAGRILTGHWGDQVLSDSDYLIDLWRSRRWRLLKRHSRSWGVSGRRLAVRVARDLASRHLPASLAVVARRMRAGSEAVWQSPWYTDSFRRLLRERFEDRRLTRIPGTSHAWAIYQQSRRGYHVQCMEWNSRLAAMHGIDIAFPYLDCDLLQFLMAIPGEMQSHEGVPRGLMREAMRGLVPDCVVDRRSKGEFTQLANQSIDSDFSAISDILGPSALSVRFGYINGPVLWKLLDDWRPAIRAANDASLANRLIDLCGMELLLRRFAWQMESR